MLQRRGASEFATWLVACFSVAQLYFAKAGGEVLTIYWAASLSLWPRQPMSSCSPLCGTVIGLI